MIRMVNNGNFDKTKNMLNRAASQSYLTNLDALGQMGVSALRQATPVESGETAASWYYIITRTPNNIKIEWSNSHLVGIVPLVILLQYGHGTIHGGYVEGQDFINPAMRPIFDQIAKEAAASLG